MSALQFLELLESRELLDAATAESLRRQVEQSGHAFTAEEIARQLVERDYLTPADAERLLEQKGPADEGELVLDPVEEEQLVLNPVAEEEELEELDELEEAAPAPAATSLFDDDLDGLEGGLMPLDDLADAAALDGGDALGDPFASSGKKAKEKKKRKEREPEKSQWDTPLMLVGGGALVFLILLGVVLFYFIGRGNADEQFQIARDLHRQGSYTQAIANYDAFLQNYPGDMNASKVRVFRAMARLRQATEGTSDFAGALDTAQQVLDEIADEPDFSEGRAELRALLPTIAEGLAEAAKASEDDDAARGLVERAEEALVLVANTKYILKSQRPNERIERVQGVLNVVTRRLERDARLREVLEQIAALAEKGATTEAYAARRALVKTYPGLKENEALARAAAAIAEAEAKNVPVIDEPRAALTDEPPAPTAAVLAVAHRRGGAAEGIETRPVFARAQGAVYGLDLASGRLLWRRWAGFEPSAPPVALGAGADADALVVDAARDELLRLEGTNGRLLWRLPLGERLNAPLATRFGVFVSTHAGKIFAVNEETGASPRHAVIQQELDTPPAIHPRAECLYQVGRHSSLYVLSPKDLTCLEVFYLGHEPGTVAAPPVVAGRYVLVAENWGDDDATLHVLVADEQGRSLEAAQEIRLAGRVLEPPRVAGRQVVVCTTRGEIAVFEVNPADAGEPLVRIAHRDGEPEAPRARYAVLRDGKLWLAGRQLSRFAIHAAGGRLVAESVESQEIGDTFVRPLRMIGDLLIHVRRRQHAAGWTVAATRTSDGRRVWETDLAAPPAGAPVVNFARREIALTTADGAVFRFDPATIKARVQDAPLPTAAPESSAAIVRGLTPPARLGAPLTISVATGATAAAFLPDAGGAAWLTYDSARKANAVGRFALPSPLACPPAALGGNLLAPTQVGQVLLLDPSTGKPRAAPFQPRLEPGVTLPWRTPGVTEAGDRAVVSDGRYKLYLLGVEQKPVPHLAALAETENLLHPITSPVAVLGKLAMALDDAGRLQKFSLPDLKSAGDVELGGQAVWGPRRVGRHVLLVSESEELVALDGQGEIAWRRPLEHGLLAGAPLAVEGSYLCAARDGTLSRINAATGATVAEVDLGQPLASGPVPFGPRLVVAGHDGALLVVAPPEKE